MTPTIVTITAATPRTAPKFGRWTDGKLTDADRAHLATNLDRLMRNERFDVANLPDNGCPLSFVINFNQAGDVVTRARLQDASGSVFASTKREGLPFAG